MGEDTFRKSFALASRILSRNCDVTKEIGCKLTEVGADELVDGGYLILSSNEDIYVSPKFGFITGYGDQELKNSSEFFSLIPIDNLQEYKSKIEKTESFFQSFVFKTKGGNHILLYCDVIITKDRTIIGINKVIKN